MRRFAVWFGAGTAWAFLVLAASACGAEEKVALDKVPKPVTEAVKARFKDAQLTGASQETEQQKPVFEVTIQHAGQNIDVTLTPEGEILLIEKEIPAKGLPKPVRRALREKYPKATYKIVEEIIKVDNKQEKLAYYELLLVTADESTLEVQVTAEGKILHEEKKDPDKKDE